MTHTTPAPESTRKSDPLPHRCECQRNGQPCDQPAGTLYRVQGSGSEADWLCPDCARFFGPDATPLFREPAVSEPPALAITHDPAARLYTALARYLLSARAFKVDFLQRGDPDSLAWAEACSACGLSQHDGPAEVEAKLREILSGGQSDNRTIGQGEGETERSLALEFVESEVRP